jgi:hypothetical protein
MCCWAANDLAPITIYLGRRVNHYVLRQFIITFDGLLGGSCTSSSSSSSDGPESVESPKESHVQHRLTSSPVSPTPSFWASLHVQQHFGTLLFFV